ncbi:conserved hypothetical protein [Ricinus communis]|uniref:Uncharacterized protein n=1 Tax=Ricinus communis TaxID=3988 RepID=B9S2Y1_RICCO|nr:conserved hypothetical protein [Ricinus communis]
MYLNRFVGGFWVLLPVVQLRPKNVNLKVEMMLKFFFLCSEMEEAPVGRPTI